MSIGDGERPDPEPGAEAEDLFQGRSPRWREVPAEPVGEAERRAHDSPPDDRDPLGAIDRADADASDPGPGAPPTDPEIRDSPA